ncbi:PREDICTED: dynactin subunit 4 [Papilio polytes]|nr:PREDICTED: dynactin subunit 4 [Papilio polytes]
MAYMTQPDYVKYVCSCGQIKPITSLYFCRHCLQIRCGFCICHEVDSHYCANCLENMPSSEARLKKNRCSSCFECPSCFHTLSTRATLAQPRQTPEQGSGDSKVENKQAKKMYYLSCFNCRWTSRDVGIPDQPVASGGWPERVNPNATRVNQLLDYYKAIAQQEKQEKLDRERKKFAIRGKYITLTDKTGLTGAMARNIAGLPSSESTMSAIANFVPSVASAEVEELSEEFYTKELNLNQITSMAQRLAAPEWQPSSVARLYPVAKLLSVKRSQRCRACDHNLTKPEYNPGSIKFKIELLAFYHVPEVKIISCEPVRAGGVCQLLLKLSNPTAHEMQLRLLQPADLPQPGAEPDKAQPDTLHSLDTSLEKSLNLDKEEVWRETVQREACVAATCRMLTPDLALTLAQRDDAAEYDDDATHDANDIIMWRKSNKVALRLQVECAAGAAGAATAALALQYRYRNAVPAHEPRDHTLHATLLLHLGDICG